MTAYLQDPNNDSATDFAVGGSTSGDLNVINAALPKPLLPSFPGQISAYVNGPASRNAPDDLCVIWIGANDFNAGIEPVETVANIKSQIAKLSTVGAKNFFFTTIPDLALTPQVKAAGGATILAATQFVVATNVLLAVELPRFAFAHQIRIDLVDINAIFVPVVYQPARFGFTNSANFAYQPFIGPLLVKDNPNNYVFWDGFHPTPTFLSFELCRSIDPFGVISL